MTVWPLVAQRSSSRAILSTSRPPGTEIFDQTLNGGIPLPQGFDLLFERALLFPRLADFHEAFMHGQAIKRNACNRRYDEANQTNAADLSIHGLLQYNPMPVPPPRGDHRERRLLWLRAIERSCGRFLAASTSHD